MLSVLAIESDEEQAALLRDLVARQIHGHLTLVDSIDAAFAAIDRCVPNLILVSALMPARDETELISRLRSLPRLASVEMLFTPLLARREMRGRRQRRWLKSAAKAQVQEPNCASATFANQLEIYLERAQRLQAARPGAVHAAPERRAAVRVSNVEPTNLLIDGLSVDLIDLSVVGAQVVSPLVLQPGRRLDVLFESNRETVRYHGEVVWGTIDRLAATRRMCYRAGIEFKDGDQRFLERLCRQADVEPNLDGQAPSRDGRAHRVSAQRYDAVQPLAT